MGLWQSKEQNNDWDEQFNQAQNQNANFERLGEELPSFDGHAQGEGVKISEKSLHKVKINYFVDEHITHEPSKTIPNEFDFTMTIHSVTPEIFRARVSFMAEEKFDEKGNFKGVVSLLPDYNFLINTKDQKITFSMNFNQIKMADLRNVSDKTPLVVELYDERTTVLNFYQLEIKELFRPNLKRRAIINGNNYMELSNVYGLRMSSLVNSEESSKCLICMENEIDTMVLPCSHMCLCHSCTEDLKQKTKLCPMCRAPFHSFSRILIKDDTANKISPK
jgi:hypothetical protein